MTRVDAACVCEEAYMWCAGAPHDESLRPEVALLLELHGRLQGPEGAVAVSVEAQGQRVHIQVPTQLQRLRHTYTHISTHKYSTQATGPASGTAALHREMAYPDDVQSDELDVPNGSLALTPASRTSTPTQPHLTLCMRGWDVPS